MLPIPNLHSFDKYLSKQIHLTKQTWGPDMCQVHDINV